MTIPRYKHITCGGVPGMTTEHDGEWVRYADHLEIVSRLNAQITELKDELQSRYEDDAGASL